MSYYGKLIKPNSNNLEEEAPKPPKCVQPGQREEEDRGADGSPTTCIDSEPLGERDPSKDQQSKALCQQHTQMFLNLTTEKGLQQIPSPPGEGRVRRSLLNLPIINPERLRTAKVLVDKAVKMRMVFSIQGPYPVVRAALKARGWVERRLPRPNQHWSRCRGDDGNDADDSDDEDDSPDDREEDPDDMYDLMSRMVRNETSYFYWTTRRETVDNRSLRKEQMTNHYAKAGTFTTKVGLCVNLRNLRWFDAADLDSFFPRCYRLGAEDEKHAFIEDYRRTACTSLIQCVVERIRGEREEGEGGGTAGSTDQSCQSQKKACKRRAMSLVASKMIDSALKVCQDFLDSLEHSDIDIALETPPSLTEQEWLEFIHNYYLVVHDGVEIEESFHYVNSCQAMLRKLRDVNPQLDTDGIHNIWIVKPGAKSRGRGIMCAKRLDDILRLVDSDPALIKDSKWVVQKYLERPLLVHGTKFDLRQWFLVTDWNPLTVWFYKKCYLRFSTQPYSVETLDSSVHLCNNSIQKHFQPSQQRHPEVPEDNMWSCDQFRAFLSGQGRAAQWGSVVVPGMKKAVVHALQTAQDLVESRRGSFELYGADFMLGRDLRPWLIEINASPTMAPSTAVTTRLCAAVQEDTLRVVLDRRLDRGAYTGGFQLIYKQAAVEVPQYVGVNLLVEGSQIRRPRPPPQKASKPSKCRTNQPAPRRPPQSKEYEAVAEKPKPAPSKKGLKSEVRHLTFSSFRVQTPLSTERPLAGESWRLQHLGLVDSLQLPPRAQSRSMDCWRRPQVIVPWSGRARPFATPDIYKGPVLPLEVISLQDPDREPSALLVPAPVVLHAEFRFQKFLRQQNLHRRVIKTTCVGRGIHKSS
ncbi:tubulin monoglycylase TTLL3 isoform X3 [Salmo trutta]|uniref:Tubulin tyrosine ligase like 3 n=1 Tax=Salmo trutta TaxID=8032 RepID=A0A674AG77_SALTR|nr:tubulin monoglycylase TTLL3-like isoform X3 [Salmo trutta]